MVWCETAILALNSTRGGEVDIETLSDDNANVGSYDIASVWKSRFVNIYLEV